MAKYLIDTTDKDGKRVVLEQHTYHGHILVRHPEMKGNIPAIKDSVENPQYIIESGQGSTSNLYITKTDISTYPKLHLKTVVDHTNPEIGYIRTSLFQRNLDPEKEGAVIYEKN